MMPVVPDAALPLYAMLPFALMLLAIALFPLWLPHWWEHNLNKLLVAALLGLPVLGRCAASPEEGLRNISFPQ